MGSGAETQPKLYMQKQLTKNLTPGEYSAAKLAQYRAEHPGQEQAGKTPVAVYDHENAFNVQTQGDTTAYQKTLDTAPPSVGDAAKAYAQAAKARLVRQGQGRRSTFLTGGATMLGGGQ